MFSIQNIDRLTHPSNATDRHLEIRRVMQRTKQRAASSAGRGRFAVHPRVVR
jgi:hypothetical protein